MTFYWTECNTWNSKKGGVTAIFLGHHVWSQPSITLLETNISFWVKRPISRGEMAASFRVQASCFLIPFLKSSTFRTDLTLPPWRKTLMRTIRPLFGRPLSFFLSPIMYQSIHIWETFNHIFCQSRFPWNKFPVNYTTTFWGKHPFLWPRFVSHPNPSLQYDEMSGNIYFLQHSWN